MVRSREYSGQRTQPDASVMTLNLFWQLRRQAQIEQYCFSIPMNAAPQQVFPLRFREDRILIRILCQGN